MWIELNSLQKEQIAEMACYITDRPILGTPLILEPMF